MHLDWSRKKKISGGYKSHFPIESFIHFIWSWGTSSTPSNHVIPHPQVISLLVCCRYYSLIDEKHILGNINIFSLRPKHTAIPHPLPAHATFTDPDFIKFIFCLDVTTIINSLTSWCRWVFRRINVPSVHKNIWS